MKGAITEKRALMPFWLSADDIVTRIQYTNTTDTMLLILQGYCQEGLFFFFFTTQQLKQTQNVGGLLNIHL